MHSLDSVNYVNKFDKEIPQYIVCRMWFFIDIFTDIFIDLSIYCRWLQKGKSFDEYTLFILMKYLRFNLLGGQ